MTTLNTQKKKVKNLALLRATWDKEVADALKKGTFYTNARELLKGL